MTLRKKRSARQNLGNSKQPNEAELESRVSESLNQSIPELVCRFVHRPHTCEWRKAREGRSGPGPGNDRAGPHFPSRDSVVVDSDQDCELCAHLSLHEERIRVRLEEQEKRIAERIKHELWEQDARIGCIMTTAAAQFHETTTSGLFRIITSLSAMWQGRTSENRSEGNDDPPLDNLDPDITQGDGSPASEANETAAMRGEVHDNNPGISGHVFENAQQPPAANQHPPSLESEYPTLGGKWAFVPHMKDLRRAFLETAGIAPHMERLVRAPVQVTENGEIVVHFPDAVRESLIAWQDGQYEPPEVEPAASHEIPIQARSSSEEVEDQLHPSGEELADACTNELTTEEVSSSPGSERSAELEYVDEDPPEGSERSAELEYVDEDPPKRSAEQGFIKEGRPREVPNTLGPLNSNQQATSDNSDASDDSDDSDNSDDSDEESISDRANSPGISPEDSVSAQGDVPDTDDEDICTDNTIRAESNVEQENPSSFRNSDLSYEVNLEGVFPESASSSDTASAYGSCARDARLKLEALKEEPRGGRGPRRSMP
ncbi:hypothetical protein HGRIS_007454 [Hohenbuehelia grisea]|uniref:Uncharacterized protein n=1 Tax=Hohenbuehelia grisea TaxID=104357 RepID=A0ABR3J5B8_9AGAR